MVWILPLSGGLVNWELAGLGLKIRGGFMVNSWWIAGESVVAMLVKAWLQCWCESVVAMLVIEAVHYLGLELSDLGQFFGGGSLLNTTCYV
jgi:hypothetical protein